jgi:FtsH-binding integral membrane protein
LSEVNVRPPITDSPWFWVLLFSSMAMVALLVMSHKYTRRQAIIERHYQANERVTEQFENKSPDTARTDDGQSPRPFASPGHNLITLWPLAVLMALIAATSATMLYRTSRAVPGPESKAESP